jgi:hypothetical protein
MSTFTEKGNTYQADEGYHDDLMMCNVLFGWLSTQAFFKELTDVATREQLYNKKAESINNTLTPFLHRRSNDTTETWVADGDYWILDDEYDKNRKDIARKMRDLSTY